MTEAQAKITVATTTLELMIKPISPVHWAETAHLDALQRDCVTAVVLKILDRKCKMDADQQEAMLAIYDTLGPATSGYFGEPVHASIEKARTQLHMELALSEQIHQLRIDAERNIEKPVMKAFKHRLRCELFLQDT